MFTRVLNHLYGYERLRHRGDSLFLSGEVDRARHEYTRARSVLGPRDYRSTTIDALILQCDTQTRECGSSVGVRAPELAYVPAREPPAWPARPARDVERPFHPGLDDLFELAIGAKDPGRIDAYRTLNDD